MNGLLIDLSDRELRGEFEEEKVFGRDRLGRGAKTMNEAFKRNTLKLDNIDLLNLFGRLYHDWIEEAGYESLEPKIDFVETEILKRMEESEVIKDA